MRTQLDVLREQHPARPGESQHAWRARLTAEGKAVFYARSFVKNTQAYQRAVQACNRTGAELIFIDDAAAVPSFAPTTRTPDPIAVRRGDVKDVRVYSMMKEAAQRANRDLEIVED